MNELPVKSEISPSQYVIRLLVSGSIGATITMLLAVLALLGLLSEIMIFIIFGLVAISFTVCLHAFWKLSVKGHMLTNIDELLKMKKMNFERVAGKINTVVDTPISGVFDGSIARFALDVIEGGHQGLIYEIWTKYSMPSTEFQKEVAEATSIELTGELQDPERTFIGFYQFCSVVQSDNQWPQIKKILEDERKKSASFWYRLVRKIFGS